MAILSSIRRWHFRDGVSIREIGRRTGLSRNTMEFPGFCGYMKNSVSTITLGDANVEPKERREGPEDLSIH